jgi:hypothetical protein
MAPYHAVLSYKEADSGKKQRIMNNIFGMILAIIIIVKRNRPV